MVPFGLSQIVEPATEPVSLVEAKLHCKVDHTDQDIEISRWISAARRRTEEETGRRWLTQTIEVSYRNFPSRAMSFSHRIDEAIRIPIVPVQFVAGIGYTDLDGIVRSLSHGIDYQTDLTNIPPLIAPAPNKAWPESHADTLRAVVVTIVAGYPSVASVPAEAKVAMLQCVAHWLQNPGDGKSIPYNGEMPPSVGWLLNGLRVGGYR